MSLLKRLLLVASMAAATLASPLASPAGGRQAAQGLEKRQQCGLAVCATGDTCCNPTCSMCTKPGAGCTQQDCGHLRPGYSPGLPPPRPSATTTAAPGLVTETITTVPTFPTTLPPLPFPGGGGDGLVTCGKNKCAKGNYCCNHSCGICAPPDGACIQLFCVDGKLPGSN
ncbi:hypothetical protein RB595_008057 [Gaeumannomyces hyphopodioides]